MHENITIKKPTRFVKTCVKEAICSLVNVGFHYAAAFITSVLWLTLSKTRIFRLSWYTGRLLALSLDSSHTRRRPTTSCVCACVHQWSCVSWTALRTATAPLCPSQLSTISAALNLPRYLLLENRGYLPKGASRFKYQSLVVIEAMPFALCNTCIHNSTGQHA